MNTRICSSCKIEKPLIDFHKGTSTDGTATYCKVCTNLYYASRYNRKTKKMFKSKTHKQCRMCLQTLDNDKFATRPDGSLVTYCRACQRAYSRKRVIERHGLTIKEYAQMLARQDYRCYACGYTSDESLHIDHDHSCCPGPYGCRRCVRGLLCSHCNRILGLAGDRPDTLLKLASYLNDPPGI